MTRTKLFFSITALAFFGLLIAFVLHALYSQNQGTTSPGTSTNFPIATSSQGLAPTSTMTSIIIPIQNGQQLVTKNFIMNGITIPDSVNEGNYLLAGDLGYCLPNTKCTAAKTPEFNIFYDSHSSTFTIGLLTEPLSQARRDAEKFLENELGVSADALCALKYYIGTTYKVNENYAAGSLGFSTCPGAVQLPN